MFSRELEFYNLSHVSLSLHFHDESHKSFVRNQMPSILLLNFAPKNWKETSFTSHARTQKHLWRRDIIMTMTSHAKTNIEPVQWT